MSGAVFILLPLLSLDSGISGDEPVHYRHAGYVYNYFASGGEDKAALNTPETHLKYYGQVVDNISYVINKWTNSGNPYLTRHIINSLLGALIIIISGLAAVALAGYRAGILAIIFMFFSPRILGHSFNNLKDIPFALGYFLAVYGLILYLGHYPKIKAWPWVWMGLGMALALGTRAGGLVLVPVFFLFVFLTWLLDQPLKDLALPKVWRRFIILACLIILTCTAGFFLAILPWPYARQAPVSNTLESLSVMTHFSVSIRQLFEGQWLWSEHLPAYYPLKYILITTPLIITGGFFLQFTIWKNSQVLLLALLNFAFIFPVFWVIVKGSNLYGGWRHLLFVYPAFAVLSACSWDKILEYFKPAVTRAAIIFLLAAGIAGPLFHIIRNHPLEYVYFNRLTGGVSGAYNKYETDYYYHSLGPAVSWLKDYLAENEPDTGIKVASNFPVGPYFINEPEISPVYTNYFSRGLADWDYGLFVNTFMGTDYLDSNNWPPDNCIHRVSIEGRVICAIVKRATKDDLLGVQLYREQDYQAAIGSFKEALIKDPKNETAQLYLAWAYRQTGWFSSSDSAAAELLSRQPMNDMARDLIGRNQIARGEYGKALESFEYLAGQNYKYLPLYEQSAIAADSLQDYRLAARFLERGYQLGLKDKSAVNKLVSYLDKAGLDARAEKFRLILNKN